MTTTEEHALTEQQNDDTHPLELDYPDGETLPEESPLDGDQDDEEGPRLDDDDSPAERE